MAHTRSLSLFLLSALMVSPALAQRLPPKVGQCVTTSIKSVGSRLENAPGSGSAVEYANGGYGVSYDTVPGIERSRRGDPIRLCLKSLPTDCPKGDNRGKEYRATNLRTHQSWTLPDSEHSCGGA
jgi:hypothetical protein